MTPNQDQILSAIRSLLIAVFTFAVGKGWISTNDATNFAALVVPLGLAIWAIMDKTNASTVTKAANIVPISVGAQMSVGIPATDAIVYPKNPPAPADAAKGS